MSDHAVISACYSDFKLVKTRGVVQLVFEVPLEKSDEALKAVGGMPNAATERWFAIARLNPESEVMPDTGHVTSTGLDNAPPAPAFSPPGRADKRSWSDLALSTQAAIRCGDALFRKFIAQKLRESGNKTPQVEAVEAANYVRGYCGVKSRADIDSTLDASRKWHRLDSEFSVWRDHPDIAA